MGRGLWPRETPASQIKEPEQPGAQHRTTASLPGSQSERRVWPPRPWALGCPSPASGHHERGPGSPGQVVPWGCTLQKHNPKAP